MPDAGHAGAESAGDRVGAVDPLRSTTLIENCWRRLAPESSWSWCASAAVVSSTNEPPFNPDFTVNWSFATVAVDAPSGASGAQLKARRNAATAAAERRC